MWNKTAEGNCLVRAMSYYNMRWRGWDWEMYTVVVLAIMDSIIWQINTNSQTRERRIYFTINLFFLYRFYFPQWLIYRGIHPAHGRREVQPIGTRVYTIIILCHYYTCVVVLYVMMHSMYLIMCYNLHRIAIGDSTWTLASRRNRYFIDTDIVNK